ncbi:glycosyltransferase family 4 protein [Bacillus sp. D386]|uniref:glycosyltransferase family 4 protein n=1 Tax=Bacillus sp. D386 TaxID=2587155 RepID=UPI001120D7B7|nr:glycosyltransferase family 4 protein [Bacillus sp. D386]
MKLLFCHDGPMSIDKHGNAYPQNLTEDVLNRYYSICEKFTMLVRTRVIDPKDTKQPKIKKEQLKVVSFPNLSSVKGYLVNRKNALKIVEKEVECSDFIIARLPSHSGNLAIDIARKLKKPYLVELVACPWDAYWNHSLKGKIMAPIMYNETKKRVKNAQYVLYVTNEFLQRRYPTDGVNIGCSDVSLPSLEENILEKRLSKIKKLNKDKPIVLGTTAAVNVKYKGQQYVIEAISQLNKQGYNFEYHLVGGGDNSYLRALSIKFGVSDKVKFYGSLPHQRVFDYLDEIDIYVQPSKQEGLPRALVEAMSRGCPAIGSSTGGIPELLNQEFIFNSGSVQGLCDLLKKLDKSKLEKEAVRSFEKAKEYDISSLNKIRLDFYKRFVTSFEGINKE